MAAMKENTRKIFDYLRDTDGQDVTAADIAQALGMEVRSVNGSLTSFQKKEWGYREEGETTNADGTHSKVKYFRLTDLGRTIDPDNPPEASK